MDRISKNNWFLNIYAKYSKLCLFYSMMNEYFQMWFFNFDKLAGYCDIFKIIF